MPTETNDGIIRENEAYPLPVFRRLTGMGTVALRRAQRRGLVVRRVGLRKYVLGRDWLAHLEKCAEVDRPN